MTFPDWAFIANMIVALGPFYLSLIAMGLLVKRKMDAILSPIQQNPLVRNVLWPLISATQKRSEKTEKMTELGKKGVQARQEQAIMVGAIEQVDPVAAWAIKGLKREGHSTLAGLLQYGITQGQAQGFNLTGLTNEVVSSQVVPKIVAALKEKFPTIGEYVEEMKIAGKIQELPEKL